MVKKSTTIYSGVIALLLIFIGVGVWTLLNKKDTNVSPQATQEQAKTFTMREVTSHDSKDDCWTVISGNVYDLTKFINRHPGGDEILRACGTDATTLFTKRQTEDGQPVGSGSPHSRTAAEQLATLKIGTLKR